MTRTTATSLKVAPGPRVTMLSVEFVASEAQIPAALWEACFPPPLEGRWWYQTIETCGLEDQFAFAYAVIHAGLKPVGIAPVFSMAAPVGLAAPRWLAPIIDVVARVLPSLAKPPILFVGSPCADEGSVGLLPGVDRRAAFLALQDALEAEARRRKAALIVWKDFPASCRADLEWLAAERRLFRLTSFPGSVVEIASGRKDDYWAAMKSARRTSLKRRLRRSAERVEIDVEVVQRPDAGTLDRLFALFRQTYDKSPVKFERLNRRFFEIVAEQPVSHFVILRERKSGDIVAFRLCFDLGARVINKFIGIDYARPREWFLYFRLWDAGLDWALARGATSIQSGQTGYGGKIETGHALVSLSHYCQHRNRLLHRVFAAIARRITWATLDDDLARYLANHPEDAPGRARED